MKNQHVTHQYQHYNHMNRSADNNQMIDEAIKYLESLKTTDAKLNFIKMKIDFVPEKKKDLEIFNQEAYNRAVQHFMALCNQGTIIDASNSCDIINTGMRLLRDAYSTSGINGYFHRDEDSELSFRTISIHQLISLLNDLKFPYEVKKMVTNSNGYIVLAREGWKVKS